MPGSAECMLSYSREERSGWECLCSQVVPSVVVTDGGKLTQMSEFKGEKDLVVTPGPGSASPSFSCETIASIQCWPVLMFAALQLHVGLKGICSLSN